MSTHPARKRKELPSLSSSIREKIRAALSELEEVGTYDFSEAEVAMDNLASVLRKALFATNDPFPGKLPSLYEVIEKMHGRFGLDEDAVDAAHELKNRLEDTYREDRDDDEIFYAVKEWTSELISQLESFFKLR